MTSYPTLFSPIDIGTIRLKNRIVMAPMESHMGNADGSVSRESIAYYRERALGGVGMVIVEFTCVDGLDGFSGMAPQLRLDTPFYRASHAKLASAIKLAGAKACVQLSHAGRQSHPDVVGRHPLTPSSVPLSRYPRATVPRALEEHEIERIIASYARAAGLAMSAGYDAVMLHGAHGYLLSQFLSPLANQRDDAWGGDLERRMRFPIAVIKAVRAAIGDRPLLYRMTVSDFLEGGTTVEDSERVAPRLCEAGVDAIDISCGSLDRIDVILEPMSIPEGVRLPMARRIREATGKPVICAGVMRHPDKAEAAILDGDTDVISLGRALLADPFWAAKAKAGRADDIRPCTSCNWCIMELGANRSVGCAENPRTGHETDLPIEPFGRGRRAAVVGAGPGGMAAALLLDQAGFEVDLYEKRASLGGNLITSATPPGKDKLFWYHDYLKRRLDRSRVRVHLGVEADAETVVAGRPDAVIIATGARLAPLDLEGPGGLPVAPAYAVLLGDVEPPRGTAERPIVIFGGGETGAETADFLAERGHRVKLVTRSPADRIARNAEPLYRQHVLARLRENPSIEIVENTRVTTVGAERLILLGPEGERHEQAASCLLLAHGLAPNDDLVDQLAGAVPAVVAIGDSHRVARIGEAVNDAYRAVQGLARSLAGAELIAC